jgi:electron transport complex protein RnfG
MAKKESGFLNMVLSLFLVTLIASTALGFVYEYTKEPIAKSKLKRKVEAISSVIPDFDNNPYEEVTKVSFGDKDTIYIYTARKGKKTIGYAVETYTKKGFSGKIKVMVGFLKDGAITNYEILEHQETPGLGDKMRNWFKNAEDSTSNILGKNPGKHNITVSKDGGDIDAITAATITSRAFLDAVDKAYKSISEFKE